MFSNQMVYQNRIINYNFLNILMRSLYTDDIAGTKPRLTIFDKGYYKAQHEQLLRRQSKTSERNKQYQWFVPIPKPKQPTYQRETCRNTIKLISEHTGLSQSMHIENLKKINDNSLGQHHRNYSLLGRSGVSSLSQSRQSFTDSNNPYFPHRIRAAYDQSNSTKFTGNRNWNYQPNAEITLPDPRNEYVKRWSNR